MKQLAVLFVIVLSVLGASPAAETVSPWAPAATAKIHPGVQMFTQGAQCTANFVYTDSLDRVYVGYAAHCAGLGGATDTNGCTTTSVPLGTTVRFAEGANALTAGTTLGYGKLVYSSWITMRKLGEQRPDPCAYNDLALVRLNATAAESVNPSVPFWGGPVGIDTDGTAAGARIYTYGDSSLRAGVSLLGPKVGVSLGSSAHGWTTDVYTVSPGIPGDSGSGLMDGQGRAMGVLSTLALAPLPGSNGVGDLSRELTYARAHSGIDGLRLVPGTEKFSPIL
jgi:hypothetical protein